MPPATDVSAAPKGQSKREAEQLPCTQSSAPRAKRAKTEPDLSSTLGNDQGTSSRGPSHVSGGSSGSAPPVPQQTGTSASTSRFALKTISVDYVRTMMLEIMRDGEVSDSEQKMMLWAIIILGQVHQHKDLALKQITIPENPEEVPAYLKDQKTLHEFMEEVQKGVPKNIFVKPKKRSPISRGSSSGTLSQGSGWCIDLMAKLVDRIVSAIVTADLLQKATHEELLAACEQPVELDLAKTLGWMPAQILHALRPLIPGGYMFQARLTDFYCLCRDSGKLNLEVLSVGFRFFSACLLYVYLKKALEFFIALLYLRFALCFGQGVPLLGRVVMLLNWLVEMFTDWDHNNYWLGCPEQQGSTSVIQLLPDSVADLIVMLLCDAAYFAACSCFAMVFWILYYRCRFKGWWVLPLCLLPSAAAAAWVTQVDQDTAEVLREAAKNASVHIVEPVFKAILNSLFTVLLAGLLCNLLEISDEIVQPKLLLLSLKLGTRVRQQT
eukprot:TRINITY_DN106153_c0_g1_i1.p1 TRINITY_DN106153_c0_g1~~TRINITY_DN106153_c0_g1_i1.p1  ORF type:complete len:495 (-),score=94.42 TRINITY_DN106153_c0_g1_i1:48-1532(-)